MRFELRLEKTCILISDQIRHKSGCKASEDGQRLEISDKGSRGIVQSVPERKVLISFAVTAKLIGVFVFAFLLTRLMIRIDAYVIRKERETNKLSHFRNSY